MGSELVGGTCDAVRMTTGSINVELLNEADIERRRGQLLARAGVSLYELRGRARDYALSIAELEVLRELERLEFLAGDR